MSAHWEPRRETARCAYCSRERPFTEGKCDHCGRELGAPAPGDRRYIVRRLANGDTAVLCPDGLTWETWYREPGKAIRHAAALNAWLDAKPTTGEPETIHETFAIAAPVEQPSCIALAPELGRILDRLAGPYDDRLPAEPLA